MVCWILINRASCHTSGIDKISRIRRDVRFQCQPRLMPSLADDDDNNNNNNNDDCSDTTEDSEACFRMFLGGIGPGDIDAKAWEIETDAAAPAPAEALVTVVASVIHHPKTSLMIEEKHDSSSQILSVVEEDRSPSRDDSDYEADDRSNPIFSLAFSNVTATQQSCHPPVRIIQIPGRGNALIATQSIGKGNVIFTERAAFASQTNQWTVRACQGCFRSLEPPPPDDLFPMAELLWGNNTTTATSLSQSEMDSSGYCCCTVCSAQFCSKRCQKKQQPYYDDNDCCRLRRVMRTTDRCSNPPEAALQLAIKMFVHLLWKHRSESNSLFVSKDDDDDDDDDYTKGLCGSKDDCIRLDMGDLSPWYQRIVHEWNMTDEEQYMALPLERFQQLVAIGCRNGVGIRTQSPFQPYYAAMLRRFGRNSKVHQQLQKAIVQVLDSPKLPSKPTIDKKDHDENDNVPTAYELPPPPPPLQDTTTAPPAVIRLRRGMDRDLNERYAPELVCIFPLMARINHSCDPNAQVLSQTFVDFHVDICAVKHIAKGEEITISYLPPTIQRRERRKQLLQARYLFDCQCSLCTSF